MTMIQTCQGKSNDWKRFGFADCIVEMLNTIGYGSDETRELYGSGSTGWHSYLREIDPNYVYDIRLTKEDMGDFCETYIVTRKPRINSSTTRFAILFEDGRFAPLSEKQMIQRVLDGSPEAIFELTEVSLERREFIRQEQRNKEAEKEKLLQELARINKALAELDSEQ